MLHFFLFFFFIPRVAGVMTQADSALDQHTMYVAASYVKFLESAGARVVPILSNLTQSDYEGLFHSLNGLLLPGGAVSLETSGYIKAARVFYDLSKEAFSQGDIFPIWGTCLGHEALTVLGAGKDLLSHLVAEDVNLPLNFTTAPENSRLFHSMPLNLVVALRQKAITYNHHKFGISPHAFLSDPNLSKDFRIVSTSRDTAGLDFVSTMEGITLPFFGIQWHSEKNAFEWNENEHMSHDPDAVAVMQHISDVFVTQARLSKHQFASSADYEGRLIYNFQPVYTGLKGLNFEQAYFWPLPGQELDVDRAVRNIKSSHMQ